VDAANFAGSELSAAQNLDAARNTESAIWQEVESVAGGGAKQESALGPITARIVPKNGEPIEVESWNEQLPRTRRPWRASGGSGSSAS
jgi:hypothetical protein